MSRWFAFLALLSGSSDSMVRAQDAVREAPLFDGRTLAGWEGDARFWSVENGEIVGRSSAAQPCTKTNYLVWRGGEVGDFELELEFKLIGGNSGVQFRSRSDAQNDVSGYQADLEDGPDWSGCFYEQNGRGVIARRGEVIRFDANGERVVLAVGDGAKLLEAVHAHEWNRYRIVARGATFASSINGVPMSTVTDLDESRAALRGSLAFQLHQGPAMEVRFRNLELVELAPSSGDVARGDPNAPKWIWTRAEARTKAEDGDECFVRREFELALSPQSARLVGSADNELEVFIDGESVLDCDDWATPRFVDVGSRLVAGKHVIAAFAKNESSAAGLQLALELEFADGTLLHIASDGSWLAHADPDDGWQKLDFDTRGWKRASVLGALGVEPWSELGDAKPMSAGTALPASEIEVPEGFTAELLYTVPRKQQGSWVSMCFDDRGRIIASDQYGPLYRVSFDGGLVSKVEELPLELGRAQGLCFAFDALYVVVSDGDGECEPGLWRAKHSASDDSWGEPELLMMFDGSGEHGPHAVVLGPDRESLWVVGGNHTQLPSPITRSRVPMHWDEDRLLPERPDPNGHAVGITAPGGWICKTDRDGKEWELVASGLRNSYDLAFDSHGEAFTFDSDMEWDIGLPWYRSTMIAHVTSGADFGWRTGSWRWPEYYIDSLPGVVDVGVASPTGMCFVRGLTWSDTRFAHAILVGDWAYGTIYAVHFAPLGASVSASFEPFLRGKPLPVTDMEIGADAALYFLVGGRRTQSALYRVSRDGNCEFTLPPRANDASTTRSELEDDHGVARDGAIEAAFASLDSVDRVLRYSARIALESQDAGQWIPHALAETRPWASIEALIALAHCGKSDLGPRALAKFAALPIEAMDEEHLLGALRALELVLIRLGEPEAERAAALAARLDRMYPHSSKLANRELTQLLVFLESPRVVAKTLALIESGETQEDQIALAWPLRTLASRWTLAERKRYFAWINATATKYSGGASFSKYLDNLRADAIATLSEAERAELADQLEKPLIATVSAAAEKPAAVTYPWTVDELLPKLSLARKGRDFERAKRAFTSARCLECHRIASSGGSLGPDLTGAGSRFGDRDLLEALIEPSKVISDQYQDLEFITKDERLFVGRLASSDSDTLRVQLADDPNTIVEIERAELDVQRRHSISRMPRALLDTLTEDEILDLVAYLRAGGNANDSAFR